MGVFMSGSPITVAITGTVAAACPVLGSNQTSVVYNNFNLNAGTTSNIYTVPTGKTLTVKGFAASTAAGAQVALKVGGTTRQNFYFTTTQGQSVCSDCLCTFVAGEQIDLVNSSGAGGGFATVWGVLQ